ncbi:uncharacterized protein CXorf58 homolog isoform X2 [Muntiacus reevesi]|uniref:uncharacterized protein CXorf58 homolog isoform X2 n=1 Tax=Muntiacus reevesi TaxID=9886 RepID=UPI003306B0E8
MSHSLKIPVTGVPKSDNPVLGKGRRVHFSNTVKTKEKQQNKDVSAHVIQRAWLSHLDKTVFQLLKHTICAAEHHVTHEILKKVSPLEAELVKDPCMKCKVRFRFSGEIFPPFIVFKIFLHTEGHGYKYFSGKKFLKPSSEAEADAYKIMGEKKFYHQIKEDERLFQKFKITDDKDIVTLKDYMQYSSHLDEIPASSGGRNNHWRRLSLENIPRTMIMSPLFLSSLQPLYRPYQQQSQIRHLGRRSKQALIKVEKMKRAYKMAKEKNASVGSEPKMDIPGAKQKETVVLSTPSFDIVKVKELLSDDELEKEEKELFAWCQDLFINNSPF